MNTTKTSFLGLVLCVMLVSTVITYGQTDTTYWVKGVKGTFTFTQVSLTNWAAGGDNSVSLNGNFNIFADYVKGRATWDNSLELGYGLLNQGELGVRKSDDKIIFTTKYGYKIKKIGNHFYWSTLIDFKSQFNAGYEFGDASVKIKISDFLAPGYLTIATGLEYKPTKYFDLIYSPIAGKITFVSSELLSNKEGGAYGVKQGDKSVSELGSFLKINFKKGIAKNVSLESKLELFSAYDRNFGNIDINWQNALTMKVNDWLSTSLTTQLLYDDDVKIADFDAAGIEIGSKPKIQFKQIFGLGLSYHLGNKKIADKK